MSSGMLCPDSGELKGSSQDASVITQRGTKDFQSDLEILDLGFGCFPFTHKQLGFQGLMLSPRLLVRN